MLKLNSTFSHSASIVAKKMGNEYVLVPIANNIADMNSVFTLNETGVFIWEHIDGKRNIKEIISAVVEKYNVDETTAKNDVTAFIEKIKEYLIITEQQVE